MTSRELYVRTLQQQTVERIPRDLWYVPYIIMYRKDEYEKLINKFPLDNTGINGFHYGKSPYTKGKVYRKGSYIDDFGSVWDVLEDGIAGEVKNPIIKTKADLDKYRLPWEILDNAIVSENQADTYKQTDLFVLAGTMVRPFERMQFLRGSEQLFYDIADEDPIFLLGRIGQTKNFTFRYAR